MLCRCLLNIHNITWTLLSYNGVNRDMRKNGGKNETLIMPNGSKNDSACARHICISVIFSKRFMDLGALLDTCDWCDKWQFSADLFHSNIWPTSFTRYKASKSD